MTWGIISTWRHLSADHSSDLSNIDRFKTDKTGVFPAQPPGQGYLCVDMHCHTNYSSDGIGSVKSIMNKAARLGFGIAITDHNSISGSKEAFSLSDGRVFIIPAIEVTSVERKDLSIYFHTLQELTDFYERHVKDRRCGKVANRTTLSLLELVEAARQYPAFIGVPHPFGIAYKNLYRYLERKRLKWIIGLVDGIEGVNMSLSRNSNEKALALACAIGKPIFGGSDAHSVGRVGHALTCSRASSCAQFLSNIAAGDCFVIDRRHRIYPSYNTHHTNPSSLSTQIFQRAFGRYRHE